MSGMPNTTVGIKGYLKGWWDALLVALKLRKRTVDNGAVDRTS